MNYKNSYEVKVKNPQDIIQRKPDGKFIVEIKEQDPNTAKVRGEIVYGNRDSNSWMSSKFW